jgi:hypothetical protein
MTSFMSWQCNILLRKFWEIFFTLSHGFYTKDKDCQSKSFL